METPGNFIISPKIDFCLLTIYQQKRKVPIPTDPLTSWPTGCRVQQVDFHKRARQREDHHEMKKQPALGTIAFMILIYLPSRKLTWQWKIPIFKRQYIFNWPIFHCHVCLPEGNVRGFHKLQYHQTQKVHLMVKKMVSFPYKAHPRCDKWCAYHSSS